MSVPVTGASSVPTLTTNPGISSGGAVVTDAGLGSGIDVNSLVPQLVEAEVGPQETLLDDQQTADNTKISALGAVTSALASLQTSVESMTQGTALTGLAASSGDNSVFTASASTGAVAGLYDVEVDSLASANTIKSSAFASASTVVGDGTITIDAGGSSFDVTLSSGDDTLSDLSDAINEASNNTGVIATVVNADDGSHLLLSATETGTANAVSVTSGLISFTSAEPAADASVMIDGLTYTSSSNQVSNAIDGVTINLVSADVGNTHTLAVSTNISAATSAVQGFVTHYNAVVSLLTSDTAYGAAGGSGPLLGDISIESLLQGLQSTSGSAVSAPVGGLSQLSQLGITTNSDGTLSLNTSTLSAALSSNPSGVQAVLSSSTSIMAQLDSTLTGYLGVPGTTGIIGGEVNGLNADLSNIAAQLSNLNTYSASLTQQYTSEFNSINTVVSGYQNISSYMTQLMQQLTPKSSG